MALNKPVNEANQGNESDAQHSKDSSAIERTDSEYSHARTESAGSSSQMSSRENSGPNLTTPPLTSFDRAFNHRWELTKEDEDHGGSARSTVSTSLSLSSTRHRKCSAMKLHSSYDDSGTPEMSEMPLPRRGINHRAEYNHLVGMLLRGGAV
jgi:hypothetical protein